ncbi:hypothetical protein PoB_005669700 [Plakobranchus ocellatus]|uniref:Uncharacterized protein n=1 Tax=Plakobranchus ocellatus TaxID=259542 RepID=A0AAV4CF42_9GAST|nr:hypothetical protein PoB_005669700 [Plakobranchus ocellatus]
MPVMLMRSLKPPELIIGTRCIVVSCNPNVAEAKIAAGAYKEQRHFIPRIPAPIQLPASTAAFETMLCHDNKQSTRTNPQMCGTGPEAVCLHPWHAVCCPFQDWRQRRHPLFGPIWIIAECRLY